MKMNAFVLTTQMLQLKHLKNLKFFHTATFTFWTECLSFQDSLHFHFQVSTINDVTMAYKDGTQVRHTRSSSRQPVTIVSYHDHLHKSDINEVKITVLGFFL